MASTPPDDVAVRAAGVSKTFRIPRDRSQTLKERVLRPLHRPGYDDLPALRDVSIDVGAGDFFGIVGRNGSGKSTLMKCVAGIYATDAGQLWTRGRLASFIELGVGFNPNLTARDNVRVNAIMLGLTPSEARARYQRIVDFAELGDFADLKLKNYSSGMHVRLAFAVMAHVDADILLIDEVLAVGDAAFQQKCHETLERLRSEGKTIVLVTHDMAALQRFCSQAVLLERGELVETGHPSEIARGYHRINYDHAEAVAARGGDRAASGDARIADVWFEQEGGATETLAHDRPAALCMRVEFREAVSDPVFGFVLTDHRNETVFAGTSALTVPTTGSFRAGDEATVTMSFHNVLGLGRYFASPQVGRGTASDRPMHFREAAASAIVEGAREQSGIVDLPLSVDIAVEPPRRSQAVAL